MPTSEEIRKRALLEDQIPLEQMTPDQIRRKDARDRKRAQRELEKQEKAKKEAAQKKKPVRRPFKSGGKFSARNSLRRSERNSRLAKTKFSKWSR